MSYETNPILSRARILKGWKNSTFPVKRVNYAGHLTLWFKIYLFLKIYFWYQNVRLLTCEIRTTEFHNKILYLSLKKHIPEKKNSKSKWKTTSFLEQIQSPLTKAQNKKARFLLYRDWHTFKHKSECFFNMTKKKIFSKVWLSKPRSSSWINFFQMLHFRRKIFQKDFNVFLKKKKRLRSEKNMNTTFSHIPHYFSKTKNIIYQDSLKRLDLFWRKKQHHVIRAFFKVKKQMIFLKEMTNFQTPWNKYFDNLVPNIRQEYQMSERNLNKMQKVYAFYFEKNNEKQKKLNFNPFSRSFATNILKKKEKIQGQNLWFFSKKQQKNTQKTMFFPSSRANFFFLIKGNIWLKTLEKNIFTFLKLHKKSARIPHLEQKILFSEIVKNLWFQNLRYTLSAFKIQRFTQLFKPQKAHIFEFLRFEQKKFPLKRPFKLKKRSKFALLKKKENNDKLSYRLSVRNSYLNYLRQSTNLKLKYLIENLIQQYFSLNVKIKLIWPLAQFKNVKFQRIFFPYRKRWNLETQKVPLLLNKDSKFHKKHYLYVGQNTNFLQKKNQITKISKKLAAFKKIHPQQKTLDRGDYENQQNIKVNMSSYPPLPASLWRQKIKKKNKYLKLKTKVILGQNEKRVWWLSKQNFISNLTTTLTLFAKYLEPQPLADHLAELIGTTKRHATILTLMKIALRTIHFRRGIGYRIALVGRINGTNKSRTFYLKKLKKNYARHTFSKNVNFAMSQARATIGAFCIKIWVYF